MHGVLCGPEIEFFGYYADPSNCCVGCCILMVFHSYVPTAPEYESLSRLSQKHLQNTNSLVALDGWSAIDQPVFHLLSAED